MGRKEGSRRCRCAWSKSSHCVPAELVEEQKAALCEPRRAHAELPQALSARRILAPNPIRFKSKPPSASPPVSSYTPARLGSTPDPHPQRVSYLFTLAILPILRLYYTLGQILGRQSYITRRTRQLDLLCPNPSTERSRLSRPELPQAACAQPLSAFRNEWECHARPTTRYRCR